MSSKFTFKSNSSETPIHLLTVYPEFYQVLNGPAPITQDERNHYPSGISQLLHTYGWMTFPTQQEIDTALRNTSGYLDPALSVLGQLSRNNTKWTVGRLAAALFELGNIRALKYLVESVPVKIRDYSKPKLIVQLGEKMELFVEASGLPTPEFLWHHRRWNDERSSSINSEQQNMGQQIIRSSIIIENFEDGDTGIYYCLITNSSWKKKSFIKEINFEVDLWHEFSLVETAVPAQGLGNGNVLMDKVALLIGEMNYMQPGIHPLRAPEDDIYIMSKRLEELHFRVIPLYDLDEQSLRQVVNRYAQLLNPNVYSFFYFAGHGFHCQGQDYCMTTDYSQISDSGVMCANEIIKILQERTPAANMLIFDMCRENAKDNPAERYDLDNAENLMILYTTCIGKSAFDVQIDDRLSYSAFRVAFGLLKENNISINNFFLKIAEEIQKHLETIYPDERISPTIILSVSTKSLGDPVSLPEDATPIPLISCAGPLINRMDPWQTCVTVECQYAKGFNAIHLIVIKLTDQLQFTPYFIKSQINQAFPYCNPKPREGFDKNNYCSALTIRNLEKLPDDMERVDVEIGLFQEGYDIPDEECIPITNRFFISINLPFIFDFLNAK